MKQACFSLILLMVLAAPGWAQTTNPGQAKPDPKPEQRYANMPD